MSQNTRKGTGARNRWIPVVAAGALLLAGCASAGGAPARRDALAPEARGILLEVKNHGWSDVVIYSVADGARTRLGSVTAETEESFAIPQEQEFATDLHLVADPIGSRYAYASPTFSANEGQVVTWTVAQSEALRSLTVR